MTKQRRLIGAIVKCSAAHLTAEEVFAAAKRELPGMAMATVYNNLNALCAQGAIHRVKLPGGPDRFDGNTAPHSHLICDRCGALRNVPPLLSVPVLSAQLGVEVTAYDLMLHWVCAVCAEKEDDIE